MTAAIIAYIIAAVLDVASTLRALHRGAREGNPLVKWLMDHLGIGWVLVKLFGTAAVAWVFYDLGLVWPIWVLAAITGVVASSNLRH